jgi:hypothetical protein
MRLSLAFYPGLRRLGLAAPKLIGFILGEK